VEHNQTYDNLGFGIFLRDASNGEAEHNASWGNCIGILVLNTGANWQIYNGPGFTGAVDIPKDAWFHLRLAVTGAQAKLYVKDMEKPVLVVDDLKSGIQKGRVALAVLTGATYFSNFEVRETPAAPPSASAYRSPSA